ncbi:FAD-dependent oxidoreductase [Psychrosphaera sp. B3R10]|uniref:NAD(P)/FAD-dependent oxidoreductase n=1 Tax=unclassified Psychrosphaera TaxID=2641570 RepID=UPI001C0821B2|nr:MULTISPECIES: FAD-dependent oxidoreductase [unclassified Psychrosphaera]MBU2882440.1 FAD-dependent oxidoreductase [Psychrosphaera sp. I2R16]MBU2990261.1 FAD-dependent oxidoreductase [Psychrosphaera sp. B3R10]
MKNIAVIGTGVSGLVSAHLLSKRHNVTVFEKNDYIGGHTATVEVNLDGKSYDIDTGFIVFNDRTYPNFQKLLGQISIDEQETEMSFSVLNTLTGLEYNGHNLNSLFAQRKNIFSLTFWRLLRSIVRFNKTCKSLYTEGAIDPNLTLGQFLKDQRFNDFFAQHYILPMGAAIWSTSLTQMRDFPLQFFIQFFYNHGLLNISDRPQWYVIPGGSKNYIPNLIKPFADNIILNSDIAKVIQDETGPIIEFSNGDQQQFDEVILACHSDQALALLDNPTAQQQDILGDIEYSQNEVILHTDTNLLPKHKLAWASWNYQLDDNRDQPAAVTYNMNILMGLKNTPHTFCVTLNQSQNIQPDKVLKKFIYHHPIFNNKSFKAQKRREEICGTNNIHFAGAYWYNGFHEDGVKSALDVTARFGLYL